ncbi:hypothetical protein C8A00DRAFT_14363 [Chaetomidium leptoderma]|uniref:Rhodopsin domain-containing protein n=1 Tax=Chaetomidium leptoderma TaxID=669021 RepID=A0AAN6VMW4_9PEZI|nr:hypothetical protein C8A00DRAFT_14363 [Chaetomidium leptoderma]
MAASDPGAGMQLPPDENHGLALQTVWWTEVAIATVFIGLRYWARILKRGLGSLTVQYLAGTGRFRHLLHLAAEGGLPAVNTALMWLIVVLDIGIFVTGFGKMAVGVTMLRIVGNTSQWQRWAILATLFLTLATCLLDFAISTFRCGDPRLTWTVEAWPTATCVSVDAQTHINILANSIQVFADVVFSVLPMVLVWRLRLPLRTRLFLVGALGLTLVTGAAAIVKAYFAATMDKNDITFNIFPSLVWFSTESMLIIVCGSMPGLHPLYERYLKQHLLSYYGSQKGSKASSRTYVYSGPGSASHVSSKKKLVREDYAEEDEESGPWQPLPDVELARLPGSPPPAK